eukprot:jgi/Tetstr1/429108/TSEL_019070.t1
MDPKRDFRLPGAAALVSEAKQFGISVATLKTMYKREWEDGTGGARHPPAANPAAQPGPTPATRATTAPSRFLDMSSDEDEDVRLVKRRTVARGAAYYLPCLAEAEAFNITDADGGSPPAFSKIPAGTLCRSCKQDAISRSIPQDVEAEKKLVRYKVFKGLVGAEGGISGKYTEWLANGVGVLEALAYREGMKEYEPSSASSTLRGFVINTCEELERFLGLADFSSRCFGQSGHWDWPRNFQTYIKKWPRRPPPEYAKPHTAIEAKLEAGLRRCWKKQYEVT